MCHAPSACLPPACRCALQVRRAMEAENEKARRAAKREYNETVRLGEQCKLRRSGSVHVQTCMYLGSPIEGVPCTLQAAT